MSRSGFSLSAGPRGASLTFGPRGTYSNVNLPGGFSYRNRVSQRTERSQRGAQEPLNLEVRISLSEDGTLILRDAAGALLPPKLERKTKEQQGPFIRQWLQEQCAEINQKIESLDQVHLHTPPPDKRLAYRKTEFAIPPPQPPIPRPLTMLAYIWPPMRRKIEQNNLWAQEDYDIALKKWKTQKSEFEQSEAHQRDLYERSVYTDLAAMETVLEARFQSIAWPRETNISFEIAENGKGLRLDVDLPEIEDMPTTTASLPSSGWRVSKKELSDTKIRHLYVRHIHGIGIRLLGESISALPTVETVTLSAYSQRTDKATGEIRDEYLYSVRVGRSAWSRINFDNLASLDVIECLAQFDLRRDLTKTGHLRPIEPF